MKNTHEDTKMINPEIYDDVDKWDSREIGADEKYVVKSNTTSEELDDALGLKPISIRLPKGMIDDFKAIAELNGIGYQPLIKQILSRFLESEQKMLANELIRAMLEQREKSVKSTTRAA